MVERAPKTPAPDFLGISEFQGTGGGVARIGERLLFLLCTLAVEFVEGFVRHQHLAPNFEFRRIVALESCGEVGNHTGVAGDIVSLDPVPAGEGLHKDSVPVAQANCSAVEL